MATPEQIFNDALNLSSLKREQLAHDLSVSVEIEKDNELEKYWAEEVERRIASHESGEVQMIPMEEMYKEFEEEDLADSDN